MAKDHFHHQVDGLSAYDRVRTPQQQRPEDLDKTVNPIWFNTELTCTICKHILFETMVIKDCMHRFCGNCIMQKMKAGLIACPQCATRLSKKNPLKSDPNFDSIISKLYPQRSAEKRRSTSSLNNDSFGTTRKLIKLEDSNQSNGLGPLATTPSSSATIRSTPSSEEKPTITLNGSIPVDLNGSNCSSASSSTSTRGIDIELILWPHASIQQRNDLPVSAKQARFIVTSSEATVEHICDYLSTRIELEAKDTLKKLTCTVFPDGTSSETTTSSAISDPTKDKALPPTMSLADVRRLHWTNRCRPLKLVFHVTNSQPNE